LLPTSPPLKLATRSKFSAAKSRPRAETFAAVVFLLRHDTLVAVIATRLLALSLLVGCSGAAGAEVSSLQRDAGIKDSAIVDSAIDDTGIVVDTEVPDVAPTVCPPRPKCDAPLPPLGAKKGFRHTTSGWGGSANHRGRDLFLKEGSKQWAMAKFAYGAPTPDNDAQDEDVDVYLLRDCGTAWTKVGTYRTTNDGEHATVEGVEDTGGRVYVDLSVTEPIPLGVGRHRVHFVMTGDNSQTDQYIEVLPADAKVVVTDVDGTLTASESASWSEAFGGSPPAANAGAADAITALSRKGYYVFYLTARPEFFVQKTRDWLESKGFPIGIVHTSFSSIGETGSAGIAFKSGELAALKAATGVVPTYGFGNTETDTNAYEAAKITPASNRYFYKYMTDLKGGTYHDDYTKLVTPFEALPAVCK
jgi:hypothetical protein